MSFLNGRVALTGGFRYQNMMINGYNYSTTGRGSLSTPYNQDAITPVVGLVIHPTRQTSIYFNRIEGMSQGDTAPASAQNVGQIFPPYKSAQYEIGAKYDIGRFSAALAFYQISRPNSYNVPIEGTGYSVYKQDGLQRNRGIELTVNGEILPGLRFNGGGTLIDADLRHTAAWPAEWQFSDRHSELYDQRQSGIRSPVPEGSHGCRACRQYRQAVGQHSQYPASARLDAL